MDSGPAPCRSAIANRKAHPGMTNEKFVNFIFTTFMRVRFTKAFDVIARHCGRACVWRARFSD
jgi:hypothetical protein